MNDLISRQAAIEKIHSEFDECLVWDESGKHTADEVERILDTIPPADVRPVVRGEWLKSPECPEEYDICSVCGLNDKHRSRGDAEHPALESIPPFCKWCGADMRPIPGDGAEGGEG